MVVERLYGILQKTTMRKTIILFIISMSHFISFAQHGIEDIYRTYIDYFETKNEFCRIDTGYTLSILYFDSTYQEVTYLCGFEIRHHGGWWMNDSVVTLCPAWNCRGPQLLNKEEYLDTIQNGLIIEVYNECGKLILRYGFINHVKDVFLKEKWHDVIVKSDSINNYISLQIKGRKLKEEIVSDIKNNHIVLIVLEPETPDDQICSPRITKTLNASTVVDKNIIIDKIQQVKYQHK